MKLLWVLCNESLAADIRGLLDMDEGISGYTAWEGLYGVDKEGKKSHWGDAVWPGLNWAFWVIAEENRLQAILGRLKELKQTPMGQRAGIRGWIQEVEQVL